MKPEKFGIYLTLAASLALLLTACSGGGSPSVEGGISGSGKSIGAINGFGSVIVNNTAYDTSSATITVEGAGAIESDLRVGQVVSVTTPLQSVRASRVAYAARIKGPVQSIVVSDASLGTASLTVLGQPVRTLALTNVVNASVDPASPNAIVVGTVLEVSGAVDANGVLIASYLERKALTEYKVVGRVTNLTPTTFRIGSLTVNYASTGAMPTAGTSVSVRGLATDFDAGANTLIASSVSAAGGVALSSADAVELEGYVTRFVSPGDFDVDGVRTRTTASTTFQNGTAASLALNVKVEVEGVVDGSGVLVAQTVEIESTGAIRIEGDVQQVDSARQRLTVLDVTYDVRAETELEDDSAANIDPLTFADIDPGDWTAMRGYLNGATVIATRLERDDPATNARLRGPVTAENPGLASVSILGVTVTAGPGTTYEDENGGPLSRTQFHDRVALGTFVTADWDNFAGTTSPPNTLSIESD